ncbi:MAG: hypothetical protein JNM00_06005 [Flavobacteriales bacterium]|nr:hypothetical protein [Flavobacteriales bacterium]
MSTISSTDYNAIDKPILLKESSTGYFGKASPFISGEELKRKYRQSASDFVFTTNNDVSKDAIIFSDSSTSLLQSISSSAPFDLVANLRLQAQQQFRSTTLQLFENDTYETGVLADSTSYLLKQFAFNRHITLVRLSKLYSEQIGNMNVILGILNFISSLSKGQAGEIGWMIAKTALCHREIEIKDLAVRCFEAWVSEESLSILEETRTGVSWLDKYIEQVIIDFRSILCHG